MTAEATGGCPIDHRLLARPAEDGTDLEYVHGVWHVRGYRLSRELLRVSEGARQAGFNADFLARAARGIRLPMLYEHGGRHRELRMAASRFFAPRTIEEEYLPVIAETAERAVEKMLAEQSCDFSAAASDFSTRITAFILGLDASTPEALGRRLDALLRVPFGAPGSELGARRWLWLSLLGQLLSARIFIADVAPVARARRRQPRGDVISHLISLGYSDSEILTEVVMYGAAGVVTTRELMQVSLWHLLRDSALRDRFVEADRVGRYRMLAEILRLEPVVGHVYRRLDRDLTLTLDDVEYRFAKGDLVDIYVRAGNVDERVFAPRPTEIDTDRTVPQGVRPDGLSFGEGAHRCPGNVLAMAEVEAVLGRLLAHDVTLVGPPQVAWGEMVSGYQLTGLRVRVARAS